MYTLYHPNCLCKVNIKLPVVFIAECVKNNNEVLVFCHDITLYLTCWVWGNGQLEDLITENLLTLIIYLFLALCSLVCLISVLFTREHPWKVP